jgi:hypothetical protein
MNISCLCWTVLLLSLYGPSAVARSCSEESSERKQVFKSGSDQFEASISSESYEKQRELRKARFSEFESSDRSAFKECMEQNRQSAEAERSASDRCLKDLDAKLKANWARVEEYQGRRPQLPPVSEGKEAFEAYRKKMNEYRSGLESLREEVRRQNQESIQASGSCRTGVSGK